MAGLKQKKVLKSLLRKENTQTQMPLLTSSSTFFLSLLLLAMLLYLLILSGTLKQNLGFLILPPGGGIGGITLLPDLGRLGCKVGDLSMPICLFLYICYKHASNFRLWLSKVCWVRDQCGILVYGLICVDGIFFLVSFIFVAWMLFGITPTPVFCWAV